MIKYSLKCDQGHAFDSWFNTAASFEKLESAGLLACSVCGSADVSKAVMAPNVSRKDAPAPGPLSQPASPAEQAMAELRKKVEENTEDVGQNFAKEARAIHDGDAPERAIRGEAKLEDAKKLWDDGIPATPLPWGKKHRN